jgi:hypothetical protein
MYDDYVFPIQNYLVYSDTFHIEGTIAHLFINFPCQKYIVFPLCNSSMVQCVILSFTKYPKCFQNGNILYIFVIAVHSTVMLN